MRLYSLSLLAIFQIIHIFGRGEKDNLSKTFARIPATFKQGQLILIIVIIIIFRRKMCGGA